MTTASHFSLLVVDDEPDLRTLYELTLLREGYDLDTAGTVQEALLHLKDRTYSAVITDMRLPDGSGLDVLRWLEESNRREKVIVITAYGSSENAVEALKAGAYDYLTKPVDLKQFRARRRVGARPWRQRHADDRPVDPAVGAPRVGAAARRARRAAAPAGAHQCGARPHGRAVDGDAAGALADREARAQHGAGRSSAANRAAARSWRRARSTSCTRAARCRSCRSTAARFPKR